mmetsp:Transcript_6806/g.7390  ORF Transcript_6806/g.7390 Transcript_6806/m.7390 type:complete len:110 (+) Transcript_6806:111-440(+)
MAQLLNSYNSIYFSFMHVCSYTSSMSGKVNVGTARGILSYFFRRLQHKPEPPGSNFIPFIETSNITPTSEAMAPSNVIRPAKVNPITIIFVAILKAMFSCTVAITLTPI